MKLFLYSKDITNDGAKKLRSLLGSERVQRALIITSAAVPYGLSPKPEWLESSLAQISQFVEELDECDLGDVSQIPGDLSKYDFVFLSGGNVFYLAHRLSATSFGQNLIEYIRSGSIVIGASAGAAVLTDILTPYASADDPRVAPEICNGLGIIDYAIVPHAGSEKHGEVVREVADAFRERNISLVEVSDTQAWVVDGENSVLV